MEQIKDIQQYKELLRWNKSRFDGIQTNCILLSSGMRPFIEEGRLYFESYPEGIALFIDEGRYFNLYYFWNQNAPFASFHRSKPVLVEEVNNNGSRDACLAETERKLVNAGFALVRNNVQVEKQQKPGELPVADAPQPFRTEDILAAAGLSLQICRDEQNFRQVTALWERYLGPTDVPLDHFTMKSDAVILNAVTAEGMVAATQFWKNSGRSSECRHTVTHPDYYRHGLAMALIQAWLETTEKQGVCRWFTWISDKNSPSLALFHKMGFRQNGRISKQYILEKE